MQVGVGWGEWQGRSFKEACPQVTWAKPYQGIYSPDSGFQFAGTDAGYDRYLCPCLVESVAQVSEIFHPIFK